LPVVVVVSLLSQSLAVAAAGAMPVLFQTSVAPQPGEDLAGECGYELTIPVPEKPINAVWVVFDRGRDVQRYYADSTVQAFAAGHNWAMLFAFQCAAKSPDQHGDINADPSQGLGRSLLEALSQFADAARHPELASAKLVLLGFSGAGALVARFSEYAPDRVAAIIAANPGHFDPFGMDKVMLSTKGLAVPALVVVGSQDAVSGVQRPYDYFRRFYEQGAPWTFIVQNQVPHCCLENARALILEWLDAVVNRNLRPNSDRGLFGFISQGPSQTTDCPEPYPPAKPVWCRGGHDEWNAPNWTATSAFVRSRRTPAPGTVAAGWMPTRRFADAWRAFVSQPAHPITSMP
jgi:dienelactone hydrolase